MAPVADLQRRFEAWQRLRKKAGGNGAPDAFNLFEAFLQEEGVNAANYSSDTWHEFLERQGVSDTFMRMKIVERLAEWSY